MAQTYNKNDRVGQNSIITNSLAFSVVIFKFFERKGKVLKNLKEREKLKT